MDQFTQFIAENIRFSQEDFAILGLNLLAEIYWNRCRTTHALSHTGPGA